MRASSSNCAYSVFAASAGSMDLNQVGALTFMCFEPVQTLDSGHEVKRHFQIIDFPFHSVPVIIVSGIVDELTTRLKLGSDQVLPIKT